jgi:kynurenine 3-monooxygenase
VRGIRALREVGLADEVLRSAIPMRGRMMHSLSGALTFQPYGKDDSESINSISRADLNLTLIQAAERFQSVRIYFDRHCTGFDPSTGDIRLEDGTRQESWRIPTKLLIGADGAYSAVRHEMQMHGQFNFSQAYLPYGYKELHIPAGLRGEFRMEKNALHIWPRRRFMMIALPNLDGSFTCTVFWPLQGPSSFAALETNEDIRRYFSTQFPDAEPLITDLVAQYRTNPVGALVTMRCQPWHIAGRAVLLGDAAHAVVPFLGQGMNAAFEDCTVLTQSLSGNVDDPERAFREFEENRKEDVDTLADLCLANFVEMRDKVGSRLFLMKKHLENTLHRWFPRRYLPLYTMISFTTIPYGAALRRAASQDRILLALLGTVLALLVFFLIRHFL